MEIKKIKTPMGVLKFTDENEEYQVQINAKLIIQTPNYDEAEEEFANALLLSMHLKKQYTIKSNITKDKKIREIVKYKMIVKGVKASELSKVTGLNKGFISKFLHGERNINLDSLDIIFKTLEIKLK